MKNEKNFRPDRIFSYFRVEWLPLAFVTLSGLSYNIGLLATPRGDSARRGRQQGEITLLRDAWVAVEGGKFAAVGQGQPAPEDGDTLLDAGGRLMTPGLVDAHTHLIFGGWRQTELGQKLRGVPYLDILAQGGGILSTVRATRAATEEQLAQKAAEALAEMLRMGVTTCEAKSGYGLDPEQEMTVTDIDGWGYIGYLSIPSIGLELPVMSEWSYAGLKVAPGRYSGSTYADNMVVCAHNYAKHFSPIKWLALGSEVYFTDMDGQRWSYEVTNVETIQPTDIDKMITASDEDAWDLTLFTCTTGGRARCAVRCTRTGYPVLETSAAGRITE